MSGRCAWALIAALLLAACWSGAGFCQDMEPVLPQGYEAMAGSLPVSEALQLVLVVAGGWDDPEAVLYRFERESLAGPWSQVGEAVSCRAGENGLAWGRGRHWRNPGWGPQKMENDGRAPAGAFSLPRIFGRVAESRVMRLDAGMPYTELTAATVCVTDGSSGYYNEVVNPEALPFKDWDQAVAMGESSGESWGVMVDHNRFPPTPGNDACVFLHGGDWGPGNATTLPDAAAKELALWLDYAAEPVLVQLGRAEYDMLAKAWGLPSI